MTDTSNVDTSNIVSGRHDSNREYYEKNKERIIKRNIYLNKLWREKNAEKLKEYQQCKITCECGAVIQRSTLSSHKKSIRHQIAMLSIVPN